jgi:Ribose/xylose/arabinose/galactoside ABC-type transport systems, permease components
MKQRNIRWNSLVPVAMIILIVILLAVITNGKLLKPNTLNSLLEQSLGYLIVGLGMAFALSLGEIDMSVGVNVCLSSMLAYALFGNMGWGVMLIAAIGFGAVLGLIIGIFVGAFGTQAFMVTIAVQIAIRGVIKGVFLNLDGGRVMYSPEILSFDDLSIKLPILIAAIALALYLLEFSPLGYNLKSIGENQKAAHYSGVPIKKTKILAFLICGAFAGLSALFFTCRTGGITSDTGSGLEMSVLVGALLGGFPVQGGVESRIYKVLIGLPAIVIIQSGLTIAGVHSGIYQFVESLILIAVIVVMQYMNRWANNRDEKRMIEYMKELKGKE